MSQEPTERSPEKDKLAKSRSYLREITQKKKLVAVTQERYLMSPNTAMLCTQPLDWHEVHGPRYCEVYITKESLPTIRKGTDDYPVGTIIVKWKYDKKEGGSPELATIMRKMPPGYAEQHGDWEFAVVNSDASQVLARGRIDSCMNCHDNYKATDYVTREYLNDEREPTDAPKSTNRHP
ncbi:MAG: cytochrome P460 family protein [Pirellula sp.]